MTRQPFARLRLAPDDQPEPEHFGTSCDWCHIEVLNPVEPPSMVEVSANPGPRHDTQTWRICLQCYANLIKFIAERACQ